jgi:hypothetical protein
MSAPPAVSITRLEPWRPHTEALLTPTDCYYTPTLIFCFNPVTGVYTSARFGALLSTGDPYSVVFPLTQPQSLGIVCEDVEHTVPLSWCGVPCRLVRIRIGLPVVDSPSPRPFTLLALLPTEEVEDVPPILRLGAEFLTAHKASVRLFSAPCTGDLIIPYP